MKPHRGGEVGHDPHDVGSTSLYFFPFDLHRSVNKFPPVALSFAEYEIKLQSLDLTNEIDG